MKHDLLTFKSFHEMLADSLGYADNRLGMLHSILADKGMVEALPPEVRRALMLEAKAMTIFTHLAIGAIGAGIVSSETMLEYVAVKAGERASKELERILTGHESCWKTIQDTKPEISWTQPKGV